MTVTNAQIAADLGELYASINGGTTSVASVRTRAENFVSLQSTPDDVIVRPLVDAILVNQVMGSIDPVNKTIGNLSVGAKDLQLMRQYFMAEANKAAIMKGISLDGLRIQMVDSEDT